MCLQMCRACNMHQAPSQAWYKHLDAVLYEFLRRSGKATCYPHITDIREVCLSLYQTMGRQPLSQGCGVPLGPAPIGPQGRERALSLLLWNFPPGSARAFRNILKENVASLRGVILWPSGAESQTREWKGLVTLHTSLPNTGTCPALQACLSNPSNPPLNSPDWEMAKRNRQAG